MQNRIITMHTRTNYALIMLLVSITDQTIGGKMMLYEFFMRKSDFANLIYENFSLNLEACLTISLQSLCDFN